VAFAWRADLLGEERAWAGDAVIVGAPMVSAAPQPPQNF